MLPASPITCLHRQGFGCFFSLINDAPSVWKWPPKAQTRGQGVPKLPAHESKGTLLSRLCTCRGAELRDSQCNGALPVCSRCEGYGYTCTYRELRVDRGLSRLRLPQVTKSEDSRAFALQQALIKYENLLHSTTTQLPEVEQTKVKQSLSILQADVQKSLEGLSGLALESRQGSEASPKEPPVPVRIRSHGYHGEVSDVRFYNAVKKVFYDTHSPDQSDQNIESYEQDTDTPSHSPEELPPGLPAQDATNECLEIYFSTIHLAYPFIPQGSFYETFRRLRKGNSNVAAEVSWLAKFC